MEYTQKTVSGTVDYASKTVNETVDYATKKVAAAQSFAQDKATSALDFGKVVVHDATTTLTAYTPGPVLTLITSTIDGAKALRQDPVGTMKPYVPTFVIHAGEKTYEVVQHTKDRTTQNLNEATGYIVTKVNGTVEYVTSVPAIGALIEKLNKLTAPVLARLGVNKSDKSSDATAPAAEQSSLVTSKEQ